jgi:hypothetical protein
MNMKKIPKIMLILFTSTSFWAAGNISLVSFSNSYSSSVAQSSRTGNRWRVLSARVRKFDVKGTVETAQAVIEIANTTYNIYANCKRGVLDSKGGAPINKISEPNLVYDICYRVKKR